MTNEEIDIRLGALAEMLPLMHEKGLFQKKNKIAIELELLNMQMMALTAMLGEIAKRLPEVKDE